MNGRTKELILIVALLAGIVGTALWGCRPGGNDADYRTVGEQFITKNAIIARKIGKIGQVDHFGDGGGAGSLSYNVYRVTGTKGNAVCHLTLRRFEGGRWKVETAVLTLNGSDYKIPTRKAQPGRRLRLWGSD